MGTRGLYCVVQDDELKVAQYGQWDAYPTGQGLVTLNFLRTQLEEGSLDEFRRKVKELNQLTDEAVHVRWIEHGADPESDLVSMDVAEKVRQAYPALDRSTCANIFQLIADGTVTDVHLRDGFAGDSLFCEWAYVINLDEDVLEVHKGFQQAEHKSGRFADYEVEERQQGKYWPVAEVARFDINNLPNDETFEAICEGNVLDRLANLESEPKS